MKGILADINIQGQLDVLVAMMESEPWKFFWDGLNLKYLHFADVGVAQHSPDSLVWATCQKEELVLITDNRNRDGDDSLEATIRTSNTPACLPVFTIGNVPQLKASKEYCHRVMDKMVDFLMRIESLRGTGRLFVP